MEGEKEEEQMMQNEDKTVLDDELGAIHAAEEATLQQDIEHRATLVKVEL